MLCFGVFALCFAAPLWTLLVPLSAAVRTAAGGQHQVIGSRLPIIAALGDDVILPCRLEPKLNVQGLTVEWTKPDLKPDPSDRLSSVEYVYLYRHRKEMADMQIESYSRRTKLFTDELKEGNASLMIMNVTLADEGRYRCFIPKLGSPVKESIVVLVVEPKTTETPTPDPNDETDDRGGRTNQVSWISAVVACVFLILGVGVGAYLLKDKCQKQNRQKYDAAPTKPLPV